MTSIDNEAGGMVSLLKDDTGIDNTIFVSTKGYTGSRHVPQLNIAIDPPHRFIAGGKHASITIRDCYITGKPIPPALISQASQFIELNRQALLDYWNGRIATRELLNRIKPVRA